MVGTVILHIVVVVVVVVVAVVARIMVVVLRLGQVAVGSQVQVVWWVVVVVAMSGIDGENVASPAQPFETEPLQSNVFRWYWHSHSPLHSPHLHLLGRFL
jgi:hypothetical protein